LIRSLLVGVTAAVAIVVLGPIGLVAAWLSGSSRPLFVLASAGIRTILWVGGVRLVVRGRERLDPDIAYVFLANHVSNLDPPVAYLATGRDVRTLAKAEVFNIPVFGKVLKTAGFPAVHRGDRMKAIAALSAAAEVLADGHDFMAFPEGTRSATGELGAFKKGPFIMAIQAGAPIAPMILRGTREAWPRGSRLLRAGIVEIEFLEPIPTAALAVEDRDALRHRVRAAMAEALAASVPVLH
jgi:1-acyl-sn-glycerol-3-phosphate acyltransferase